MSIDHGVNPFDSLSMVDWSLDSIRKLFLLILFLCFFLDAQAVDIQVIGFEGSPYSIVENDQLSGIGPEVLRALAQDVGADVTVKYGVNIRRVLIETDKPNVFIASFVRSADREFQYHWIGELAQDKNCFLTLKSHPSISSLEEAKKYSIGVYVKSAAEQFLRDKGLTNIEAMPSRAVSLRKLAKGRIDAYYTSNNISYYSVLTAGLNPKDFVCGKAINEVSYYIAASLKTSPKLVDQFRKSFEKFKKNRGLERILKKYHINEVRWD